MFGPVIACAVAVGLGDGLDVAVAAVADVGLGVAASGEPSADGDVVGKVSATDVPLSVELPA